MAKMIPESVIEDIQNKLDIVQIISGYIPVKKAGANYKAACPFHQEKTPSFMVSPSKQIYHCFGCGAGGDVFSFVMRYENVDFPEAVRMLAEKVGVNVPRVSGGPSRPEVSDDRLQQLYALNECACAYYQEMLTNDAGGKIAHDYFRRRGLKDETISRFRLGYSPDGWEGFLRHAQRRGFGEELLLQAGLILRREQKGGCYDRFRHRIMFPISDSRGRIVGFAGRVLDDSVPKYMNSPETPVYLKSKILYGMHHGKDAMRTARRAILVEGYMDYLALVQEGFGETMASCGTSLTTDQIRFLKRFAHTVIMIFDPDQAGENATVRNLDICIEEDIPARVVRLPKGYDPDTYVRKHGAQEFTKLLNGALPLFEYKLQIMLERHGTQSVGHKVDVCKEMLPTIAKVRNAIERSEYIKRLAQAVRIDENDIREELGKARHPRSSDAKPEQVARVRASSAENRAEMMLLGLMMHEGAFIQRIRDELGFEYFNTPMAKRVAQSICQVVEREGAISPAKLMRHMDNEIATRFIAEFVSSVQEIEDTERTRCFDDCVRTLKRSAIDQQLVLLRDEIKRAESEHDMSRVDALLERYAVLTRSSYQ